jgi:hypothetical protein
MGKQRAHLSLEPPKAVTAAWLTYATHRNTRPGHV